MTAVPARAPEPVTCPAAKVGPGDAVVIRGVGTVPVRDVCPLPTGELLVVLSRDRLGLILAPGSELVVQFSPTSRDALRVLSRRDRCCRSCGGRGFV